MKKRVIVFLVLGGLLVGGLVYWLVLWQVPQKQIDQTPATNQQQSELEESIGIKNIHLFYYAQGQDEDENGNIQCSRQGLVPVERQIATSQTLIQDTIQILLQGKLTQEEKNAGISTEYPLEGFMLVNTTLQDDVLTLEFADPLNKTVGGSCRVGILWFQIEETAKQFEGVNQVRFTPEDLFQP